MIIEPKVIVYATDSSRKQAGLHAVQEKDTEDIRKGRPLVSRALPDEKPAGQNDEKVVLRTVS
jgi:hypothetical protein